MFGKMISAGNVKDFYKVDDRSRIHSIMLLPLRCHICIMKDSDISKSLFENIGV